MINRPKETKVVVLTGAGISAESGLKTFRDSDGLWEGHDVYEVASPVGWQNNPKLVLDFYNARRKQLKTVSPNAAHTALAEFEKEYNTLIITQNVDNLHERAGSKNIIHLHGELCKVRSTLDAQLVYEWYEDLNQGDNCAKGSQLRPHIVWFGESVPMIETAIREITDATHVIIIGTSMQVYPAAGLIQYVSSECAIYYVDPNPYKASLNHTTFISIEEKATTGVEKALSMIRQSI